jgi:uncharacterized protein (DUF1697 family)
MARVSRRYVALLRGVNPMNAKMSELKRAFELAGFQDVKTVLGSGNVLFSAHPAPEAALAHQAEAAMKKHLGSAFFTIVRSVETLQKILTSNPFAAFRLEAGSKRVVTFLNERPSSKPKLPIELGGARILVVKHDAVFTAYVPSAKGPVFMSLIERTFGKALTTRTWETVTKCAK